jgi:histidinol dehydrogenase
MIAQSTLASKCRYSGMMNRLQQLEPCCEPARAALKQALKTMKKFAELEGLGAHGKSAEIRK